MSQIDMSSKDLEKFILSYIIKIYHQEEGEEKYQVLKELVKEDKDKANVIIENFIKDNHKLVQYNVIKKALL